MLGGAAGARAAPTVAAVGFWGSGILPAAYGRACQSHPVVAALAITTAPTASQRILRRRSSADDSTTAAAAASGWTWS